MPLRIPLRGRLSIPLGIPLRIPFKDSLENRLEGPLKDPLNHAFKDSLKHPLKDPLRNHYQPPFLFVMGCFFLFWHDSLEDSPGQYLPFFSWG